MTKIELVNIIEKSGIIVNFSRSYEMKKSKAQLEQLAKLAIAYQNKKLDK